MAPTPAQMQAIVCGANNSAIKQIQLETPIGRLNVRACKHGLHSISYEKKADSPFASAMPMPKKAKSQTDKGEPVARGDQVEVGVEWLRIYFSGGKDELQKAEVPRFCFPSDESTEFERNVWMTLFEKTSIGDTLSYGELAKLVGNPKAARAVGTAMKKNPLPIIIPCHRVVRANGDIGNYNSGSSIKESLLQHEQGGRAES